ncbi:MAG: hypothetical protein ACJ780_16725 [Solirubrobacteraceae bacterium]
MTFRPDLLDDRHVAVAGDGEAARSARGRLQSLGARVDDLDDAVLADEADAAEWARQQAPLHALLMDAAGSFGSGGPDGLRRALEGAWRAARAVAAGALIATPDPGRLLLIAPRSDAGPHASAARAALENLARTLSVEWARYGITAVAITPGLATTAAELAELTCFLVSRAGGYFSGCVFDLGAASAAQ